MRVAQVVASLETQYGGPSRSVFSLAQAEAAAGHSVELFSTAPAAGTRRSDGNLTQLVFRRDFPGALCPSAGLQRALQSASVDVFHNHGLWLRTLAYAKDAAQQAGKPLVISPRGMMGAWAWNHHRLRKQLCSHLVHPGALRAAGGWHATSSEEAADIRRLGFAAPICIAPNGVVAVEAAEREKAAAYWFDRLPEARSRPVALFYSRLHSKKRVKELIRLWSEQPTRDWILAVIGIPEEYSEADLTGYAALLGVSDRVRVFSGEGLPPPYPIASLFVLASHNENFGMSIAEAMTHGLPVLVTDATPWSGVVTAGGGWWVPWSGFADALETALQSKAESLTDQGRRARAWVLAEFSWAKSARLLIDFYQTLTS